MFVVSEAATAPVGGTSRGPASGWSRAIVVAICLSPALILFGGSPATLPDSVLPCAPCHNHGARDQVAEWLISPYSEAKGGRGCTDCHDRYCSGSDPGPTDAVDRATPRTRDSKQAVRLTVEATCYHGEILAEVAVSNVGVGHLIPTGSSDRTLVLEVSAEDRLSVVAQPRLRPFATTVSRHRFELPSNVPVQVSAQLIFESGTGARVEIASATSVCPPDDDGP